MLDAVKLSSNEIAAALVAISFAAGLNVYATLATLGLLAHAGFLPLPPALHVLTSWWVIGASSALFLVEFFADKVPAFDLIWNALHTFVRVPVAAPTPPHYTSRRCSPASLRGRARAHGLQGPRPPATTSAGE